MKVYLLAAGYATRMHPLTLHQPKPLLEVAGAPILTHILREVLRLEGLTHIVLVTNDRFHAHFEAWAAGLDLPVPCTIVNDGSRDDATKLGAIGDIALALDRVPPGTEDWAVIAGDNLIAFDLLAVAREFRRRGDPLLSLRRVPHRSGPSPYNEVTLGEDGVVTRFREKPRDPQSDLAAIALYFFPPVVAPMLRRYLSDGGNPDAPGHFVAWLVDHAVVRARAFEGQWFDIGSLATLEDARSRFRPR